jgi:hypothetical protein
MKKPAAKKPTTRVRKTARVVSGVAAISSPLMAAKPSPQDVANDGYTTFHAFIQARVDDLLKQHGKVFRTDAKDLFDVYLNALPSYAQDYCKCNTCKRFFDEYAGLVVIDDKGKTIPFLWAKLVGALPPTYSLAAFELHRKVAAANVIGVKLFDKVANGVKWTGAWSHYSFDVPTQYLTRSALKSTHELEAEKTQEFLIVDRALSDWMLSTLQNGVALLETETLYRSEKVLGPVKWLCDLKAESVTARTTKTRRNLVWRAVASAPTGFCHPRSAVTASLLDDIQAGKPFDQIGRAFAAKMHPLQYQRPQAAPKAGNIKRAEEIFNKLGLAASLERRFAGLHEVERIWRPFLVGDRGVQLSTDGIFADVAPRTTTPFKPQTTGAARDMTWAKFQRDIMPLADKIEYLAAHNHHYTALVTAVHPHAPPLFKWDHPHLRNPVSWYLYYGGSMPAQWGLRSMTWVPLTGVTRLPPFWYGNVPHGETDSVILLLQGAYDTRASGLALFPECLRPELHEVRSVIEAYSKTRAIQPLRTGTPANGIKLQATGAFTPVSLKATVGNTVHLINLDRWE